VVPTLPDPGSRPRQLFGLLEKEHGDPRYTPVLLNRGAIDLPCSSIHSYLLYKGRTSVSARKPVRKSYSLRAWTASFGRQAAPLQLALFMIYNQPVKLDLLS